jgi:ribonuclease HI
MTKPLELTIHIDGAARGNPGPAAYACVFTNDGEVILEEKGHLGTATNNVAEYTALVKALEKAAELRATSVNIRSDSELLVKQMNGQYRVKNEQLLPLYQEANRLARQFDSVQIAHVFREQNREADRLCNEALDEAARSPHKMRVARNPAAPAPQADWNGTVAQAERLLHDAAQRWAKSGCDQPPPGEVLQAIIGLFQDHGFLRKAAGEKIEDRR